MKTLLSWFVTLARHVSSVCADTDSAQLTDWTAHIAKEVLAKNFQTNISTFNNVPGSELYIFPGQSPSENATAVEDPAGQVPQSYSYGFSKVTPTPLSGGSIKMADSSVFPVSQAIAVAEVTVVPGAMRFVYLYYFPIPLAYNYQTAGSFTYVLN